MHACRQGPSQAAARDGKTRGLVGGLRDVFSVHVPHEQGGGETEEIAAEQAPMRAGAARSLGSGAGGGPALPLLHAACRMIY